MARMRRVTQRSWTAPSSVSHPRMTCDARGIRIYLRNLQNRGRAGYAVSEPVRMVRTQAALPVAPCEET